MTDSAETLDLRRRRLAYRAHHRGIKEMDLILGRFADEALATMDSAQIEMFEALIEVSDRELYAWITGREPVPAQYENDVMSELLSFTLARPDRSGGD